VALPGFPANKTTLPRFYYCGYEQAAPIAELVTRSCGYIGLRQRQELLPPEDYIPCGISRECSVSGVCIITFHGFLVRRSWEQGCIMCVICTGARRLRSIVLRGNRIATLDRIMKIKMTNCIGKHERTSPALHFATLIASTCLSCLFENSRIRCVY
jgi:hypothetical protein